MADPTRPQNEPDALNLSDRNNAKDKLKGNRKALVEQGSISSANGSGISPTTEIFEVTRATNSNIDNAPPMNSEHYPKAIAGSSKETQGHVGEPVNSVGKIEDGMQNQEPHPDVAGLSLLGPLRKHRSFDGTLRQDTEAGEITEEFLKAVQRDEAKKVTALRAYTARVQQALTLNKKEKFKAGEMLKMVCTKILRDKEEAVEIGRTEKKGVSVKYVHTQTALAILKEAGNVVLEFRGPGLDKLKLQKQEDENMEKENGRAIN